MHSIKIYIQLSCLIRKKWTHFIESVSNYFTHQFLIMKRYCKTLEPWATLKKIIFYSPYQSQHHNAFLSYIKLVCIVDEEYAFHAVVMVPYSLFRSLLSIFTFFFKCDERDRFFFKQVFAIWWEQKKEEVLMKHHHHKKNQKVFFLLDRITINKVLIQCTRIHTSNAQICY